MPRRTATLLTSTLLLIGLFCAGILIRVPYSELSPGPTVNTLGEHEGEPVMAVQDEPTYESSGHLNMTTVRVTGVNYRMNLFEAVRGWLADDAAIVPYETLYPEDVTADEVDRQNVQEFRSSQHTAKVAALEHLGYEVVPQMFVGNVNEGGPAEGLLYPGDAIVAVDGTEVAAPGDVADLVTAHEPGEEVVFTIVPLGSGREEDGGEAQEGEEAEEGEGGKGDDGDAAEAVAPLPESREVTITTTEAPEDQRAVVGIGVQAGHVFPFSVDIELADIGGPSAGLMFALGLVDRLTEEDLTGGAFVAGTGTIDVDGGVGPIGGVTMKTIAAHEAGAEFFLTPAANCAAAVADAPDGLTLVRVETLAGALDALEDIRGDTTEELPLCSGDAGGER